jgi:hypothetical protein
MEVAEAKGQSLLQGLELTLNGDKLSVQSKVSGFSAHEKAFLAWL